MSIFWQWLGRIADIGALLGLILTAVLVGAGRSIDDVPVATVVGLGVLCIIYGIIRIVRWAWHKRSIKGLFAALPSSEDQQLSSTGARPPATVFLSYAREDESIILPIERALRQRGIRVLRDLPSLPLGAHNVAQLEHMIAEDADAVIFLVTPSFLESDFIWRHEVPSALARWQSEPRYGIIPILHGPTFAELQLICTDRGLRSLTEFNAEHIPVEADVRNHIARIARRTLEAAIPLRLARDPTELPHLTISLHTFPFTAPDSLHLDLNWAEDFANVGPAPDVWRDALLPALEDVATTLAHFGGGRPVEAWLKARLPAAVALGHAFPHKGSVTLRVIGDTIPEQNEPSGGWPTLKIVPNRLDRTSTEAIVEIPVSRDIVPSVTRWRTGTHRIFAWRVRCAPSEGVGRGSIQSADQARSWARQVGSAIRDLWDREGVVKVHLFLASPVGFAVLIGQELRDRHPVAIYYGDNESGFQLAYTLTANEE